MARGLKAVKITTKMWAVPLLCIVILLFLASLVALLYTKETKRTIYKDLYDFSNLLYLNIDNFANRDKYFYKRPIFKRYIQKLKLLNANDIFIINRKGIVASADENGINLIKKSFVDKITNDVDKKTGIFEYKDSEHRYLLSYKYITNSEIWIAYRINQDRYYTPYMNNIQQFVWVMIGLLFAILFIAAIFIKSVQKSIQSLKHNVSCFVRTRNIAQVKMLYRDELHDIYEILHDYSMRSQDADIKDDRLVLQEMENMVEGIKQGDFSNRLSHNAHKQVLKKLKSLINSSVDILNSHLTNVMDISNNYINNDFDMPDNKKLMVNGNIQNIYEAMNKLGLKFSTLSKDNVEVSMHLDESYHKISEHIEAFKNHFKSQINSLDEILENIFHIYGQMDEGNEILESIDSTTEEIIDISRDYKNFSDNSIEYISQVSDTYAQIDSYIQDMEYYTLRANILSTNASIKNSGYGDYGKVFGQFIIEFKELADKVYQNVVSVKEIITTNINKSKEFYLQYEQISYDTLIKKINQISSFVRALDSHTKAQFTHLTAIHQQIDGLVDKNKMALLSARKDSDSLQTLPDLSQRLIGFLVK